MQLSDRQAPQIIEDLKKENEDLRRKFDDLTDQHSQCLKELIATKEQGKRTEEELSKSDERYRNLVESANSLIIRLDNNGIIKFVNEFTLSFFGFTREEMTGKNVRMIVPEKEFSGKDLSDLVENVLSDPLKFVQHENENIKKNGEHVWISWTNRAIRDEYGNLVEILTIGNDITERKKAESALLVEHNILEAVINNIGAGFVVADVSGNILSLNNAALKIHDFQSEEDRLQRLDQYTMEFELEFPDGKKVTMDEWPLAQAIRGKYIKDFNVRLIRHKSKSQKNISYNTVPIYDNFHNRLLIVLTMTDYTDIYKRTEELAKERELFEGIFNNIPVMMTVYDPELKNFRFNKEYMNTLGWTEEDATGGNLMAKVYPDPVYRKKVSDYMQSLESGWKEWNVTTKDGKTVLSSWANILLTSGIIIGIGIDMRDRREAEEKLRENEQRLQVIFNNAAIGIVEVDSENRFVAVNDRSCEILGYTHEELTGKYISDVTAPGDIQRSEELNAKLLAGELNIFNYEKRYIKKDGSLLWVHVTVSAIRNSHRHFLNSIGTFEDISKRKEVEQALRDSEEMFAKMFQSIPVGISLSTSDGAYFKVNQAWLRMLDFQSEAEVIGKTSMDLGLVPEPEHRKQIFKEFEKNGYVRDAELTIYTKTMQKRIVSINMDSITINGIRYILSANTDVTEKKNADEAVKRIVTILKQAGLMASLGAWEIEFENGYVPDSGNLRWSDQVYRIFGFTPGSVTVTNKLFFDLVHPDDRIRIQDVMTTAIKEKSSYTVEHRIIRSDGVERKVIEHAEIIFEDDSGKALRIMGAIQDITEQKLEQEKLLESEEKFRSLFENITEGVALHELVYENGITIDYKIIDINPAFMEITGIHPEKARGVLASQLYNAAEPPYLKEYAEVAVTGKPMRFEAFYPPMNRHFIISAISPKKGQFATVFEDVTEQKKNEFEIKQRNEELTRFIYTVSHDLKSPLVTIKSFTSYLKEDIDNQDKTAQEKDIRYIQNAADKMGKLLDELLELSRIGRQEKPKTTVPLKTVVQSAIDLVAGYISRKNISIQYVGPSVELYGHAQRFIQLYQNLLDNAAKFMGSQSEPIIEIGTYSDKEKNEIVLFVRDNGSGIDPRYRHKIFGLFEKMDNKTDGTGIGLALVKRIVEVHGGKIWFESEGIGKGTTFYFTMEGTRITI